MQLARKHCTWIHNEPIDSVAFVGDEERDVQRRTLLAVKLLIVGDGAVAIGV
jgi:hypothetical protein